MEAFSRPFLNVIIGNTKYKFLVDSGASLSCMSEKAFHGIYKHWNLKRMPLPYGLKIKSAGGHALVIKGLYQINVKILEKEVKHNFVVIKNLMTDGILGTDFIAKHKVKIGGTGTETKASWTNIDSIMAICQKEKKQVVTAEKNVTIPGNTILSIDVKMNKNIKGDVITEALPKGNIGTFESLVSKTQPRIVTINATNSPIFIRKDDPVAFIQPVQEICEMKKIKFKTETNKLEEKVDVKKYIEENTDLSEIPKEYRSRYKELLYKYKKIISLSKYDLGNTKAIEHRIHLKKKTPIHCGQFRVPECHLHGHHGESYQKTQRH